LCSAPNFNLEDECFPALTNFWDSVWGIEKLRKQRDGDGFIREFNKEIKYFMKHEKRHAFFTPFLGTVWDEKFLDYFLGQCWVLETYLRC
jgi:hypothetical protein